MNNTLLRDILDVMASLKKMNIVFRPDGIKDKNIHWFNIIEEWIDIDNLKMLYFTIKDANENGRLPEMMVGSPEDADIDMGLSDEEKESYKYIDISRLELYLKFIGLNTNSPFEDIKEDTFKLHLEKLQEVKTVFDFLIDLNYYEEELTFEKEKEKDEKAIMKDAPQWRDRANNLKNNEDIHQAFSDKSKIVHDKILEIQEMYKINNQTI